MPPRSHPSTEPAAGLYVHTPYCETKCGYCDFYSVPAAGRPTGDVVQRIIRELDLRLERSGLSVRTAFVGGGTPTILPPEQLRPLLEAVARAAPDGALEEFTVEANPATVDADKARLLQRSGVTRVSMGAQSFFPAELAALERLHSPDDIAPSVATLREAGIAQLNLDLIFGIPGQTLESWSQSLERAIDLQPDHLACYGLTYEPGTPMTAQRQRGSVTPCEEGLEAQMYLLALDTLQAAGFAQYEISNFARPGCQCRHNVIYWRNEPYIGVGPSAAGCMHGRRYKNVADIAAYIRRIDEQAHAEAYEETVDAEALVTEMVMMQLRLNEGLSLPEFRRRTRLDPNEIFKAALPSLVEAGWLDVDENRMALTRSGRLVADAVIRELVSAVPTLRCELALPILAAVSEDPVDEPRGLLA